MLYVILCGNPLMLLTMRLMEIIHTLNNKRIQVVVNIEFKGIIQVETFK